MNNFYVVLGDWSDDGHGKMEKILIESPFPLKDIQEAYKSSCKRTGIYFHDNREGEGVKCCVEYKDRRMSEDFFLALKQSGCPFKEMKFDVEGDGDITEKNFHKVRFDEDTFIKLLMWFIGLSLPHFKWSKVKDVIPCFNGYWQEGMNHQMGYGLYN